VSVLALALEAFALSMLLENNVPMFTTVVSGSLVMQAVLTACCVLFGVLWFKALSRVCTSIRERGIAVQRTDGVMRCLSRERLAAVTKGVVALQAGVRGRQAKVRYDRVLAMESFEAATSDRNHMLWLVNCVVLLYLVSCVYIICLYGTCALAVHTAHVSTSPDTVGTLW
jgi:hypothetical protein